MSVRLNALFAVAIACGSPSLRQSHAVISSDPQALDFGSQTAGATSTKSLTIQNTGQVALQISSGSIANDTRHAFSLGTVPTEVAAGATAQLSVTYTAPPAEGADGATLTLFSNADNAPELAVSLSGRSVAAVVMHTLTVTVAGSGTVTSSGASGAISCPGTCSVSLPAGSVVSLTPSAAANSRFSAWSGACTGATCSITLNADAAATATFVGTYEVSVTFAGAGSGTVDFGGAVTACTATCTRTFDSGATVAISGTAGGDSVFTGFSGGCSGTATCEVTAAKSLTATFTPAHTLTVTTVGSGSVSGNGISCPGTCSVVLPEGTAVSLTATATAGSRFGGWSNACTNDSGDCAFTLTGDATATATFVQQYDVNITFAGGGAGTVDFGGAAASCTSSCTRTFDTGTALDLTGSTTGSNVFAGFTDGCTGNPSCTIASLTATTNITATFNATHTLTVTGLGSGAGSVSGNGISCTSTAGATSGVCVVTLPAGTPVALTPGATGGSRFGGWSNACTNSTGDCDFTLDGDATATASFIQQYTVTITFAGTGSGTVDFGGAAPACTASCAKTFDSGATLAITGTASSGSTFSGFTQDCTAATTCNIASLAANEDLTATFASAGTVLFGGAGDQFATGITYANSQLWISGNEANGAGGIVARMSVPIGTPDFVNVWPASGASQDYFNGIAAGPAAVYALGASYSMTSDTVGGKEFKMAIVKYPFSTTGAPTAYEWFQNIGGGTAIEYFAGGAVLSETGTTYVYGVGMAQYNNLDWIVKANDPTGSPTTMPAASTPVWSHNFTSTFNAGGNGAAPWANGGGVYAVGSDNDTSPTHPILAAYDTAGTETWVVRGSTDFAYSGFFRAVTALGTGVYAVGQTAGANTDAVAERYDTSGALVWTKTFDLGTPNDALTAAVALGTHLYAVGFKGSSATSGCNQTTPCTAVLLDINAADGTLLGTTTYGDGVNDTVAYGIATDGTDLFVAGHQYTSTDGYDIYVKKYAGPPANPAWTLVSTTGGPPSPRAFGATLADSASPILFAGYHDGGPSFDSWILNGTAWSQLSTTGGPPGVRDNHGAVYDAANNRMMIFGGCTGGCSPVASDYWVLSNADGTAGTPAWSQLTPGGSISGRQSFAMAYDATANRTIIFGGQNGGGSGGATLPDVSVLTNANGLGGTPAWSQLTQSGTEAPGQYGPAWGYDEANGRLIVVGGAAQGTGTATNAAYVLSNANGVAGSTATWANLVVEGATGSPPTGQGRAAAYDPATNRLVMIGGANPTDVWVLSNANGLGGTPVWSLLTATGAPTGLSPIGKVYDPSTKTMLLLMSGSPAGTLINQVWKLSNAVGP